MKGCVGPLIAEAILVDTVMFACDRYCGGKKIVILIYTFRELPRRSAVYAWLASLLEIFRESRLCRALNMGFLHAVGHRE